MQYLIERLKEPSTWAGIAVLATMLGFSISQEELAVVGAGIGAVLAIIVREGGK